ETLKLFIGGEGADLHARQEAVASRREAATAAKLARLKGLRRRLFEWRLGRVLQYPPLREQALAAVGLGYPLYRRMLFALGERFVAAGMITTAGDVFWLEEGEVEEAASRLDREEALEDLSAQVPMRQAIWRAARRATPPLMLPQMKLFGFDLMQLKTGRRR